MTATAERIEIAGPGVNVSIDRNGRGTSGWNESTESSRPAAFTLQPRAWDILRDRIAAFEQDAGATDPTIKRYLATTCEADLAYVTDQGSISIRWIGGDWDRIYIADFRCDPQGNIIRNQKLLTILQMLPHHESPPLG